jgi:hypothetical protein
LLSSHGGTHNKPFKRTNNSWLFAPSSLILANYHLPLNGALYNSQGLAVNKFFFIISIILIGFAVIMFLADFMPVDMFNNLGENAYMKLVPNDSFSWAQYKIHAFLSGIVLLCLCKFTNLFGL